MTIIHLSKFLQTLTKAQGAGLANVLSTMHYLARTESY